MLKTVRAVQACSTVAHHTGSWPSSQTCWHRLGMSEGSVRALEDEAATLKSLAKEVAQERPHRMAEAADLSARLRSAEERVRGRLLRRGLGHADPPCLSCNTAASLIGCGGMRR